MNVPKPLTAEQAVFLLHDAYLPVLKAEHRTTRAVLEAVPAGQPDYRPDPNAKTAMELVRHIAASENRFLETTISGEFSAAPAAFPDNAKTPADFAAWYAERFDKNCEALTKLSGEQLLKMVDFRGLFSRPAVAYLQIGLNHSIHHRGQLSTYLRPMGGKVPAIYGESYDRRNPRKPLARRKPGSAKNLHPESDSPSSFGWRGFCSF
jgi:uncharacterized damage-inducible protein DinB